MTGRPRAGPEPWAGHKGARPLSRSRGPRPLTWPSPARPHACSLAPRPLTWPSPAHLATIQPWLIG